MGPGNPEHLTSYDCECFDSTGRYTFSIDTVEQSIHSSTTQPNNYEQESKSTVYEISKTKSSITTAE
jgi:hypothetical protein